MVKRLYPKKIFWLAITVSVIANLALGNYIFSKQLEINAADAERIKTALGMAQTVMTVSDIIINNKDLATVLNTIIKGSTTGVDVTYGLVVLGALNEMDLVDLVVSGRYRDEAREYFNSVLDQTINLTSYWKNTSQNIFSLMRIGGAVTPTTGLTTESVAILEKTMSVIVSAKVWLQVETYNGMWRYFQDRMNGDTHKDAWYDAEVEMGYVPDQTDSNKLEGWLHDTASYKEKQIMQFEEQFLTLYDNWAPYVTPFGISEEYKKQVKEELSGVLIAAVKENVALAKNEPEISLIDKLVQQLTKLKNEVAALISQINPFKAGVALNLPDSSEELTGVQPLSIEIDLKTEPNIEEIQEELDDILAEAKLTENEPLSITTTTIPELSASTTEPVSPAEPTPKSIFCERASDNPARFRVLINEVAWMGTINSPNDEWIELKNIWGIPVKLNGWQLLDKDRQIKIVFSEDDIIPAGGYYLLERTDDNSMPNAKADLIYTGALGNTNEALYLFDSDCRLEDEVLANPNWPAGDNSLKNPMSRFDVLDWYTGDSTPGGENSSPPAIGAAASAPAPSPTLSSISSSPQIFITEVQIDHSSSSNYDFIELYNPNTENIDISGFQLKKKSSTGNDDSIRVFPDGNIISAQGYFLWANSEYASSSQFSADVSSTQTLAKNNSIAILDKNKNTTDAVAWGSSTNPFVEGQPFPENPDKTESLGRKWSTTTQSYIDTDDNSTDFEIQIPTPKEQNQTRIEGSGGGGGESPPLAVVINEIAWMGMEAESNDEWIELYNNTTSSIDIDGWRLNSSEADGVDITILTSTAVTTTIPAQGFYLIERTDDNAVSNVSAGWTGSFGNGLSNTKCEILYLYDNSDNLIDGTACSGNDWPGGEASPDHISMERISSTASGTTSTNWASNNLITKNGFDKDGNPINGTPKAENSVSKSFTEISGGLNINQDFTFTKLGSPYLIWGTINVSSGVTLSIEPGTILKFKKWDYSPSGVDVHGTLLAGENGEEPVVFTSIYDKDYAIKLSPDENLNPSPGDWHWLYFTSSTGSKLENVIVRYSGGYWGKDIPCNRGAVQVEGEEITIKDSIIENSLTQGLWFKNSSGIVENVDFLNNPTSTAVFIEGENSSPTIKNSTFRNNNIGILIESSASPAIENNVFKNNQTPIKTNNLLANFSGNTAQNNELNGILVSGFGFSDTVTQIDWQKADLPYILESSTIISAGQTLDVKPGVVIKLKGGSRIYIEGSLKVQGQAGDKIVFTSFSDDEYGGDTNNDGANTQPAAGQWNFISFSASSTNSILNNVIVRYGGWYNASFKSGAIKIENTDVAISNSLFENNLVAGLELENSTTTIINTIFRNHRAQYGYAAENSMGIWVKNESGECPDLTSVTFGEGANANTTDVYPADCRPQL